MQIVIDIPEETYNDIQSMDWKNGELIFSEEWKAIHNGTPLPKRHGKLKDTDAICKDIISALGIRDENYLLEAEKAVYKIIKNAATIIEADKESEEE